jgi:hypothetical protein
MGSILRSKHEVQTSVAPSETRASFTLPAASLHPASPFTLSLHWNGPPSPSVCDARWDYAFGIPCRLIPGAANGDRIQEKDVQFAQSRLLNTLC